MPANTMTGAKKAAARRKEIDTYNSLIGPTMTDAERAAARRKDIDTYNSLTMPANAMTDAEKAAARRKEIDTYNSLMRPNTEYLAPAGPPFNYPGDPAPYVPGWTPSSTPSKAYDPVGAADGLFAPGLVRGDPTSEAAVQRWNIAHLLTSPAATPSAPTGPTNKCDPNSSDPVARAACQALNREAIVHALMTQTPGGLQGAADPSAPSVDITEMAPPNVATPATAPSTPAPAPTTTTQQAPAPATTTQQAPAPATTTQQAQQAPQQAPAPAPAPTVAPPTTSQTMNPADVATAFAPPSPAAQEGFTVGKGPMGPNPSAFSNAIAPAVDKGTATEADEAQAANNTAAAQAAQNAADAAAAAQAALAGVTGQQTTGTPSATFGAPGSAAPGITATPSGVPGSATAPSSPGAANAMGAISGFGTGVVGAPGSVSLGHGTPSAVPGLMGQTDAATLAATPTVGPPASPTAPAAPMSPQAAAMQAAISNPMGVNTNLAAVPGVNIGTNLAAVMGQPTVAVMGDPTTTTAAPAPAIADSPNTTASVGFANAGPLGGFGFGSGGYAPGIAGVTGFGATNGLSGSPNGAVGVTGQGFGTPGATGETGTATQGAPGSVATGPLGGPVGSAVGFAQGYGYSSPAEAAAAQTAANAQQAAQDAADDAAADAGDDGGDGGDGTQGGSEGGVGEGEGGGIGSY